MKRLKKLLKDNSGESMTELIVAFSMFMLALAALSTMVTTGFKLNRMAADADRAYYGEFTASETGRGLTVTISSDDSALQSVLPAPDNITYYKNPAGLIFFEFDTEPTATEPPAEEPGTGE